MKKKMMVVLLMVTMMTQVVACSLKKTCKVSGCDETDIYQDGYCKLHYYEKVGENLINELGNW